MPTSHLNEWGNPLSPTRDRVWEIADRLERELHAALASASIPQMSMARALVHDVLAYYRLREHLCRGCVPGHEPRFPGLINVLGAYSLDHRMQVIEKILAAGHSDVVEAVAELPLEGRSWYMAYLDECIQVGLMEMEMRAGIRARNKERG